MKQFLTKGFAPVFLFLALLVIVGQVASYLVASASWLAFMILLPKYFSMVAFWGPIMALIAGAFVWTMLKLLGFNSLAEIREESVGQNNPAPAIIFTGTLVASILFLMLVLR